ncbi:HCCA isomerase/glutathione S-transferase kappa [Astrocystis sublimbata]|nr:HCCA isomerase/glutathione S-transferase kappa [Astrocystis sublimbata]
MSPPTSTPTPTKEITLYVDVVSPFVYIAYHILENDPVFKDVKKTYVPVFLGGIMNMAGNTPPIRIKNKDTWINQERNRWSSLFAVPMESSMPPNFPPNTLHVMRALCVIASTEDDNQRTLRAILTKLFAAFWVSHAPIFTPETYAPIIASVLGASEAERILAEAGTKGKEVLLKNTDKAFAEGAFGLPWIVCRKSTTRKRNVVVGIEEETVTETEGFWGVDHLGHVARFLGLPKPGAGAGEGEGEGGWKAML